MSLEKKNYVLFSSFLMKKSNKSSLKRENQTMRKTTSGGKGKGKDECFFC